MVDVTVNVNLQGLDRVKEAVTRIQDAIEPPSITESLGKGADILVGTIKAAAPHLSGELAASIDKREDDGGWVVGPLGDVKYANIQNVGGTNFPTSREYFRFKGEQGWVTVRSVTIPGSHYVQVGFEAGREEAAQAIKDDITSKF